MTQKSTVFIYLAMEAWNHALYLRCLLPTGWVGSDMRNSFSGFTPVAVASYHTIDPAVYHVISRHFVCLNEWSEIWYLNSTVFWDVL